MTRNELIHKLHQFPNYRVVIDGYEIGVEDVQIVRQADIMPNANVRPDGTKFELFGEHSIATPDEVAESKEVEHVIYIERRS